MRRLKAELERVAEARDILKMAAAYFAKNCKVRAHAGAYPPAVASQPRRLLPFCIRMLGYIKHRPIRWRVKHASTMPGASVGVRFEETRNRDLPQG